MSMLIVGLDVTILNVALPSIQKDFGASVSGAQWTIDAYTLVIACLLMLSGLDRRPARPAAHLPGRPRSPSRSARCSAAIAPGLGWLIAFRALQAVGGSMLNPVAMSIVTNVFTEPAERARAIGWWGGVAGVSIAGGPLLGGAPRAGDRLARGLLDQRPGRARGDRAHRTSSSPNRKRRTRAASTRSARC